MIKYGTEYPSQSDIIQNKRRQKARDLIGVDHYLQLSIKHVLPKINNPEWLILEHHTNRKTITQIAYELDIDITTLLVYFKKHNIEVRSYNTGYSIKCIKWLDMIMHEQNIFIQHALNLGEYIIPGTRYKADGYCKETNTVYEFHGDIFHGNPVMFKDTDRCSPYEPNKTAKELFEATKMRECKIIELGYNLVTIWENEFDSVAQ